MKAWKIAFGFPILVLAARSVPACAETWVPTGPFAGRTPTALLSQGFLAGRHVYAAFDGDGVFRSADDGTTWVPVNDGLTDRRVSALAMQNVAASCPPPCDGPGLLYAATRGGGVFVLQNDRWTANNSGLTDLDVTALVGDAHGVLAGTAGGRIFRSVFSTAGPQTWSRLGSPGDGTAVAALAFGSGSTVFCGTGAGLYRSTNSGASWSRTQQNSVQFLAGVRAIAVNPSNGAVVFAAGFLTCVACGIPATPSVMRSSDGGMTWADATGELAHSPVNTLVATDETNLFAGTSSGAFRSVDAGSTWQNVGLDGLDVTTITEAPFPFSEAVPLVAGVRAGGLYRATLPILQGCSGGPTTLCLRGGRFSVSVIWQTTRLDPSAGDGQVLPLTFDTGAFWFFQPSNIELIVKVLDGRAINGHFWVFWGSLTDVGYTITVTDLATGTQRTYTNLDGQLGSGADPGSF